LISKKPGAGEMAEIFLKVVEIGAGATALLDIWAIFLNAAFRMPLPNWGLVGRWFCGLLGGKVFHEDIAISGLPRILGTPR
jgi:hypothetical protein